MWFSCMFFFLSKHVFIYRQKGIGKLRFSVCWELAFNISKSVMSKDIKLMTFAAKKATKLRLAMHRFYPVKKGNSSSRRKESWFSNLLYYDLWWWWFFIISKRPTKSSWTGLFFFFFRLMMNDYSSFCFSLFPACLVFHPFCHQLCITFVCCSSANYFVSLISAQWKRLWGSRAVPRRHAWRTKAVVVVTGASESLPAPNQFA